MTIEELDQLLWILKNSKGQDKLNALERLKSDREHIRKLRKQKEKKIWTTF